MAAQKEKNGIQGVSSDRTNLLLGDFGKRERGATLEIDIVGEGECSQRGKGRIPEEVGSGTICSSATQ